MHTIARCPQSSQDTVEVENTENYLKKFGNSPKYFIFMYIFLYFSFKSSNGYIRSQPYAFSVDGSTGEINPIDELSSNITNITFNVIIS